MHRHNMRTGMLLAAVVLLFYAQFCKAGEVIENVSYKGAKTTIKYAVWGGGDATGCTATAII